MHVVHVMTRLAGGGAEENTLSTCRWQIAHGLRVTLLHGGAPLSLPGIDTVEVPAMGSEIRLRADLTALAQLGRLYDRLRPDVIHTHQSKAGILGRLAARGRGLRVVHGIHIVPFEKVHPVKARGFIAAERLAARATDAFLSVSDAAAAAFVGAGIAPTGRMHVVRSGMDLDRFRNARPAADLPGPETGDARPLAVMLASLEPRKRHVPFLEALAAEGAPLRVVLAGDGRERTRIEAAVERLGLQSSVTLLGHRPDPEALLAAADLSLLASMREGLPRVVIQSLAAGTPVVAASLPGLGEVLEDGANGCVTPPDDLRALVREAARLGTCSHRLATLSTGARRTDLADWSLDRLGRRTTELYGVSTVPA